MHRWKIFMKDKGLTTGNIDRYKVPAHKEEEDRGGLADGNTRPDVGGADGLDESASLYKEKNHRMRQILLSCALKNKRWHVRPMLQDREIFGDWYSLVPTLAQHDRDEFFNFLRMTPESFDWLLGKVSPFITKTSKTKRTCTGERLAVTLRYLASGDSHISLPYLFRIWNQTISKIVTETTAVIYYALRKEVFQPISSAFWRQKAAEFESMWLLPCTHSVVLLALSDAKYKFILADVGAKGREHDAGVFAKSDFGQLFINHQLQIPNFVHRDSIDDIVPYVIARDGVFPLHQHLMKPFDKPVDAMLNYNNEFVRDGIDVDLVNNLSCAQVVPLRKSFKTFLEIPSMYQCTSVCKKGLL
ncbi:hypothetical protein FOCC_FOCC006462 [Frankliniella occidentalis]|nr:hypothetical protein FOCC_FOCC006462 [Frankliniella occidentalis]